MSNNRKSRLHYWETIWMFAVTDLKMRYQGSWLGAVWVFLKPFCLYLIINFVFAHLFFAANPTYSIRLLVGIILWSFFSEATTNGMTSLLNKSNVLKKIYLPKWVIIISSTVHSALAFSFNLVILFLFLFFYYRIYPGVVDILLFGVYVSLVYGISVVFSFVAAPLYIRIRDVNQIWEVLLQLLFYGSPIIYPMSMVPERIQTFLYINPMTLLIEHSRVALIDRGIARIDHLLIFIAIFLPCLAFSMIFLKRASKNLVEKM